MSSKYYIVYSQVTLGIHLIWIRAHRSRETNTSRFVSRSHPDSRLLLYLKLTICSLLAGQKLLDIVTQRFRSLGKKIKTKVSVRTKAKNWRLSFSTWMRAHVLRSKIRTAYETVGKIHRKLKCDLSEMNDYLWPRETLRYEIYSIKTLIVIIETLVMIITLATQF